MINLSLSPSKIESYRQHREEEYNGYINKQRLIDTIVGNRTPSKAADFGTAFHLVIEKGPEPFYNQDTGLYHIKSDGMANAVICSKSEIQHAIDFHNRYPSMNFETWLTAKIIVDEYSVNLRMRIDGMIGNEIHENKTKKGNLDVHFYERSLPWKIYTQYTEAIAVQFNFFPYKEPAELAPGKKRRAGARSEREVDYIPFRFYRGGEEVDQEIRQNIRGLIHFCHVHDIMDFITVKK